MTLNQVIKTGSERFLVKSAVQAIDPAHVIGRISGMYSIQQPEAVLGTRERINRSACSGKRVACHVSSLIGRRMSDDQYLDFLG